MAKRIQPINARLMCGAAAVALLTSTGAYAAEANYDIAPQPLDSALREFGVQSGVAIMADADVTFAKRSPGFSATAEPDIALRQILDGTGLTFKRAGDIFVIAQQGSGSGPQSEGAAGDGADSGTVEALIVTAQKREEDIQDVPIAISAFTQESLERSQIAGGPDLMTQVPNMTFTKTNFSSYSISIRGIGTQAISATTDPAVAVTFNNSAMIRNRFFEQEFYDLQRVEVLRGPQGTLYGRNATAGVVNILTARPKHGYEAKLSGDVANYSSTRVEGMVNVPLVEDRLALRLAGAWTRRDGFVTNDVSGQQIDGRDLWSTRLTLGFEPTERISAYFTWEHFEEDDDRLRSGKQICKKANFPTQIGGVAVPLPNQGGSGGSGNTALSSLTYLSQGCEAVSLYSPEAFQTPNGYALPYYGPLNNLGFPALSGIDVYQRAIQSQDLRVIESSYDPTYRAKADVAHLQFNLDLTEGLSLTSETLYSVDESFSTQDFNRFSTTPGVFGDTDDFAQQYHDSGILDDNNVFCDPQLGCSDRLTLGDLSTHTSSQFGQELRLGSDFDGPFNFSLGANFVRYDTVDKYYVFINSLSLFAAGQWGSRAVDNLWIPGVSDNRECLARGFTPGNPLDIFNIVNCVYIDPNPVDSLNDLGHNYFLSKNPYRLISYAVFGEVYYNVTPDLKLTAGFRYTVDKKHAPRIPSWLLASQTIGHPVAEIIDQEWKEPTGRLAIDWKPVLSFTDDTLLYFSYAHGYKAGGANPPSIAFSTFNGTTGAQSTTSNLVFTERLTSFPKTFEPEFIDAYELGTKNTLLDGRLTFNANLFYYDYEGYQISQIVNRSALNLNFDAEVWGAEVEADWRPLDNLRFGLRLGFEETKVGDGQSAIDLMDRTAGNDDYIVIRPLPTIPSNCIIPVQWFTDAGNLGPASLDTCSMFYSGVPQGPRDPATVPNNGEGIYKDLSGNELPNAPKMTTTFTVDYTIPLHNEWLVTFHADLYRQSEAWTRIFNFDPYDRLKPFEQVNLAAIFVNEDAGWNIMAYVKNTLDSDNITGAFLNSDDTSLTTNVFLNEPRLYGIRVTKAWSGDAPWGDLLGRSSGPYPLTVEIGGGINRIDAPNETLRPDWVDAFTSPDLPFPMSPQEDDLDWGDGREVKVTYAPGDWFVSAGVRFGRTNGSGGIWAEEYVFGGWRKYEGQAVGVGTGLIDPGRNYTQMMHGDREAHTLADFAVGRDFGLGLVGEGGTSKVSVGVRYAEFKSATHTFMNGLPNYTVPFENNFTIPTTFDTYEATLDAKRKFEGTGIVLSWEASRRLFGGEDTGGVKAEWTLSGGALRGKSEAQVEGEIIHRDYSVGFATHRVNKRWSAPVSTTPTTIGPRTSSDDITVPTFGASLGLSYEIDRFKVGAGYRWERYFDVLDGGIEEAKDVDRTIDGPYFKLSVGFGG